VGGEEISRIDDGGAEVVESVVVRTEDERAVVWWVSVTGDAVSTCTRLGICVDEEEEGQSFQLHMALAACTSYPSCVPG
jgi:hypothetical protein